MLTAFATSLSDAYGAGNTPYRPPDPGSQEGDIG